MSKINLLTRNLKLAEKIKELMKKEGLYPMPGRGFEVTNNYIMLPVYRRITKNLTTKNVSTHK